MLTLHGLWPTAPLRLVLANGGLILGTSSAASFVTAKLGDRQKRTTNALPYPDTVTVKQQEEIKKHYARAQFTATHVSMLHDPTINFFCLLAIQSAPFLMTLVRKGKIDAHTYHRFYALSLWVVFLLSIVRLAHCPDTDLFALASVSSSVVRYIRTTYNVDPKVLWSAHIFAVRFVFPKLLEMHEIVPFEQKENGLLGVLLVLAWNAFCVYRPLFFSLKS
jgi:hypothetical protein